MFYSLLLIPLITGPVFIIAGLVQHNFPPRKINSIYGYRTSSSMKDQETWDFAQLYSAREMIRSGALLMLTSLVGFMKLPQPVAIIFGIVLLITLVAFLFFRVERAIKHRVKNS